MDKQHSMIGRKRSAEHHASRLVFAVDHDFGLDHLASRQRDFLRDEVVQRLPLLVLAGGQHKKRERDEYGAVLKETHELEW
jgi:hypothetical protein